jgi:magnesium-transporting ATPase (P-type)
VQEVPSTDGLRQEGSMRIMLLAIAVFAPFIWGIAFAILLIALAFVSYHATGMVMDWHRERTLEHLRKQYEQAATD